MTVLTLITLASGLALAPVHTTTQPATTYYQQARQTLNSLTATTESRLRSQALERALTEGLDTFRAEFSHIMETHAQAHLAGSRSPTVSLSWVTN